MVEIESNSFKYQKINIVNISGNSSYLSSRDTLIIQGEDGEDELHRPPGGLKMKVNDNNIVACHDIH